MRGPFRLTAAVSYDLSIYCQCLKLLHNAGADVKGNYY